MSIHEEQTYFVSQLGPSDYRPMPEAVFEIQVLNEVGQAEWCAYLSADSDAVIAVVGSTTTGPVCRDTANHGIPAAVIRAARCRRIGYGERVNAKGEVLPPF